ncbi:cytochrome P450 monooxygenase pc-1 [Mycena amicta]|nr:cytochrome P450 monooxygenase pc-1 [Mycena amicta]
MQLPPGIAFLGRVTLRVLSRPILLGLAGHYAARRAGVSLPSWVTVILAIASLPIYIAYKVHAKLRRQRAEAEKLGARLAPVLQGKRFGNLDFLGTMVYNRVHGYPGDGFNEVVEEYGPVVNFRVLWIDALLTVWPEHIKHILATGFTHFEKGKRFQAEMDSVLGSGVFNSDGEMWKFHRAMTRPFFSKDKISHFDIFDQHADTVVKLLRSRTRAGYAVDFQDLIGRFTMDSATEFLFGTCVNSLHANVPYAHNVGFPPPQSNSAQAETANRFVQAFNESMQVIAEREYIGAIWPLWEMWEDKTKKPMKVVNAFLEPIIHAGIRKKRTKSTEQKEEREAQTLLEELLMSTDDPKVLRDEILNILLAGRDTTMHVMTMVIYFLATYPDVCIRLRGEVLSHVGPVRRPTYDDIKDMKYLRAVINESMRLYPSVPFNVRDCVESTTWPSPDPTQKPIYVPAGAKVPYSVFMMHRRKDLWGEDAEEFDPDRFIDERLKKYLLNNSFAFLPFNAGPRICLGQQFAYSEMSFMLIRLLQNFSAFALDEAAFAPGALPPPEWKGAKGRKGVDRFRPKMHLTMYTTDGMWITATEASEMAE